MLMRNPLFYIWAGGGKCRIGKYFKCLNLRRDAPAIPRHKYNTKA